MAGSGTPSSLDSPTSGDDGEDDVTIIRDVLSVQQCTVVGGLAWDKLQYLLHSLCDRIASQATRLDKAEEQGSRLATFKEELEELCKNAMKEVAQDQKHDAEQMQNWIKLMEGRLDDLEKGVEKNTANVAVLENVDMDEMKSLPPRVETLEQATKELNQGMQAIDQEVRDAEKKVEAGAGDKLDALSSEFDNMEERLKRVEAQTESLKQLLAETSKAQASDLDVIQKACRAEQLQKQKVDQVLIAAGLQQSGSENTKGVAAGCFLRENWTVKRQQMLALRSEFESKTLLQASESGSQNSGSKEVLAAYLPSQQIQLPLTQKKTYF